MFGGLVVGHGLARVVWHRTASQRAQLAYFHRLWASGPAHYVAMAGFCQAPEQLSAAGRVDVVYQCAHTRYVDWATFDDIGAGQALQQWARQTPLMAVVGLFEQLPAASLLTVLQHQVGGLVERGLTAGLAVVALP
ncbi:hypothetical protein D9M71_442460 [compost metagenome]